MRDASSIAINMRCTFSDFRRDRSRVVATTLSNSTSKHLQSKAYHFKFCSFSMFLFLISVTNVWPLHLDTPNFAIPVLPIAPLGKTTLKHACSSCRVYAHFKRVAAWSVCTPTGGVTMPVKGGKPVIWARFPAKHDGRPALQLASSHPSICGSYSTQQKQRVDSSLCSAPSQKVVLLQASQVHQTVESYVVMKKPTVAVICVF